MDLFKHQQIRITIYEVNEETQLVAAEDKLITNGNETHGQRIGIVIGFFYFRPEPLKQLCDLIIWQKVGHIWDIQEAHIVEFKCARVRELPVCIDLKSFGVYFFISEARFVAILRLVCIFAH